MMFLINFKKRYELDRWFNKNDISYVMIPFHLLPRDDRYDQEELDKYILDESDAVAFKLVWNDIIVEQG